MIKKIKLNPWNKIEIILVILLYISIFLPFQALAYGPTMDGGKLNGIVDVCTCSGGTTIRVQSYVDNSSHVYLYELGVTQLYQNYNILSGGNYFLTTLAPFAVCMVYHGEDCDSGSQSPEGIFLLTGTSFNLNKKNILTLLDQTPGFEAVKQTFSKISPTLSGFEFNL